MKLETLILNAKQKVYEVFLLSEQEDRQDLWNEFLDDLDLRIEERKFSIIEKITVTVDDRKKYIRNLSGMTFRQYKDHGASYIITEDGKFRCPDGKIKKSASGAIEYQLNQQIKIGTRGKTWSGWACVDTNGKSLDDYIRSFIING